jgi:predicted amidohydrolase
MKLSLPQRAHKYYDIEHNLDIMKSELAKTDADLTVFPEMFLTGYSIRDKISELALAIDSKPILELAKVVKKHKRAILFGMPEADPEMQGRIYNTAMFIDKSGNIDQYRKFYLVNFGPFEDKRYFHEGRKLPIFEVEGTRFGVVICYDIFFPELAKAYALRGVDLIICISAAPTTSRPFFETMVPARAVESTVFFAYSNLIGPEKNMTFFGGNTIVDARANQLVKGKYFEEDDVQAEIDPSELSFVRSQRPTLRDSRIELFQTITELLKPDLNE